MGWCKGIEADRGGRAVCGRDGMRKRIPYIGFPMSRERERRVLRVEWVLCQLGGRRFLDIYCLIVVLCLTINTRIMVHNDRISKSSYSHYLLRWCVFA